MSSISTTTTIIYIITTTISTTTSIMSNDHVGLSWTIVPIISTKSLNTTSEIWPLTSGVVSSDNPNLRSEARPWKEPNFRTNLTDQCRLLTISQDDKTCRCWTVRNVQHGDERWTFIHRHGPRDHGTGLRGVSHSVSGKRRRPPNIKGNHCHSLSCLLPQLRKDVQLILLLKV